MHRRRHTITSSLEREVALSLLRPLWALTARAVRTRGSGYPYRCRLWGRATLAAGDEASDMAWHGEAAARGQTAAEGEAAADNRAARGDGTKKRKHQNKQNRRSRKATANRGESSQEVE